MSVNAKIVALFCTFLFCKVLPSVVQVVQFKSWQGKVCCFNLSRARRRLGLKNSRRLSRGWGVDWICKQCDLTLDGLQLLKKSVHPPPAKLKKGNLWPSINSALWLMNYVQARWWTFFWVSKASSPAGPGFRGSPRHSWAPITQRCCTLLWQLRLLSIEELDL